LLKTGRFNDGKTATVHKKILDYDGVMAKAHARSLAMFPSRFEHQKNKR
jgi:hypothetical protein